MKKQVDSETARGQEQADATADQCIKDTTQLEGDIKYSGEKAEEAAAAKEDQAAKSASWQAEAMALAPQIADAESSKDGAKKEHAEASATFNKEEQELTEAVSMLTSAYAVLKRSFHGPGDSASFLQRADSSSEAEVEKALSALSSIIDAGWVSSDEDSVHQVKAFLSSDSSDDLDFKSHKARSLMQQPQATTSVYDNKSGGILKAIESMQEKASEELTKLREKALKARHSHELLVQDLVATIEMKTEQLNAAKTHSAEAAANSQKAGAEYADASESNGAYKDQLRDTTAGCEKAASDWAHRKEEAVEESAVIGQAVDVLSAKFSFIQMTKGAIEVREQVSLKLRELSQKYGDFALLQAADRTSKGDPFSKVTKMIADMITKLEDDQAKEAAKEGKCKSDLAKGKRDVKVRTQQLAQLQARADKANARVSELASDLQELADAARLLEASRQTWTKNRNAARSENAAALEEAKTSIEALNSAIGILTEFYGGKESEASLLQTSTSTQKLSEKADAVIQILQTAQSDFEKIRQSTETAEKDQQATYEKDMQDAEVSMAKNKALREGKTSEQASVKVQIGQIDQDLGNAQKNVEAASSYLSAVMEQCANKPMSFEERQAKRKSEIEGLREALNILNGDQ
jgi:hypothetical protein